MTTAGRNTYVTKGAVEMGRLFLFLSVILLSGCASTKSVDVISTEKISEPKIIAINSQRAPWVYEIEKRLRSKGFTVKRFASQNVAVRQESPDKKSIYNEAATRYILNVDGYAPSSPMERCIVGGGYKFDFIDVELIDVKQNVTLFHYANSGYSEGCPMGGSIFSDIAELTSNAWR
ncbi:hypothetical protein N6P31_16225 [Pectobacterium betavasculorum]|uniref:hypothetical protein n=1 Tax=Pectobacterium betavasculorum TaxID=55207 RepID=UPI00313A9783